MTWMLTHNGAVVDLRWLAADQISVLDIAASLSRQCRFAGHTSRHYSVAEHSLHVCNIMERELMVAPPTALLAGLLHDAHEAYTGDLTAPMKALIGSAWAREEERIAHQVRARFGVTAAFAAWRATIHNADLMALAVERRDLMVDTGPQWPSLQDVPTLEHLYLPDYAGMTADDWRDAFVERFAELCEAINENREVPQ